MYPNLGTDKIYFSKLKKGSQVNIDNSLDQIQDTFTCMDNQTYDISQFNKEVYFYFTTDQFDRANRNSKFTKE